LGNDETAKGSLTLVTANGDRLELSFEIVRDRGQESFVGSYSVTGGTGRFTGAAGSGRMTLTPRDDGTASFTLEAAQSSGLVQETLSSQSHARTPGWHFPRGTKGW
jgi:hypothetical protein